MIEFERRRRNVQEINLTALIDIVFHLLVFVILTTSFVVSESMELSLPSAHAGKAAAPANLTRIQVMADTSVVVDGAQSLSLNQLSALLASRIGGDPDLRVAIFTSPGVSVQQLVAVMDAVYLTGGRNVQVDKAR